MGSLYAKDVLRHDILVWFDPSNVEIQRATSAGEGVRGI